MKSTRNRILNRAVEMLGGDDPSSFTMQGLAEDLALSSGSVFHAFPSRKALIASAFAEGIARYHEVVVAAIEDSDDPRVSLRSFVASHLEWVEANAGLARFLFTSQPDDVVDKASELAGPTNDRFAAVQNQMFGALVDCGAMAGIDRRLAHSLAIGPSQEYCRKWLRGTAPDPPSQVMSSLQAGAVAALVATLPETAPVEVEPTADQPARTAGPGTLTYQGAVYPWHLDHMGHMNVMWYVSKFDEATWHFLAVLGLTPARLRAENRGMAAIEQHLRYLAELHAGDLVEIHTRMIEQHDKVLIFEHEMIDSVSRQAVATSRLTGVHLDIEGRRSQQLPDDVKETASALLG